MTVVSTVTLTAGTLNTNAAVNQAILIGGSWFNNGGTFTTNFSSTVFKSTNPGQSIKTRGYPFRGVWIGSNTTGGYYTMLDSMTVSTITINASNTLELAGLSMAVSSFTNNGTLVIRGTETITRMPFQIVGATVIYNAASGTPVVMSTFAYQNLVINGGANTTFTIIGDR